VLPIADGEPRGAWARIGEGGVGALRELGFDEAALAELQAAGVGANASGPG
jgi:hypothetical protein